MSDFGHACSPTNDCTLHNLHCAYPDCAKGRREGIHAAIGRQMSDEIVARLRELADESGYFTSLNRAADLIERLQAEKVKYDALRNALKRRTSVEQGWHENPENHTLDVTFFFGSLDPRPLIDWNVTHATLSDEVLNFLEKP